MIDPFAFGFIVVIVAIAAILIHVHSRNDRKLNDNIDICYPCYRRRYVNQWLGWRTHKGVCSVCHRKRIVDSVPLHLLERKEQP